MDLNTDKLVQSVLGKDSLAQCSTEELRSLSARYPYFPIANLLLAKKLQGTDEVAYNEQLKKLSLHIPDPLWLEYLLNDSPASAPAPEPMIFEPYHTVDYFASQGIKFKEEEKPTDKFGQQLKSFTEWLRSMKKLPATEAIKPAEQTGEIKVVELANQSLTDREVVTEAMAEVWEKQDHLENAIAVYEKLSLLEPSKSAYFAAKIEGLKKKK